MGIWFFSREKALSFHTKDWLLSLDTLRVCSILIRSLLPRLIACVCAGRWAVIGATVEYRDCATCDLVTSYDHNMVTRCTMALSAKTPATLIYEQAWLHSSCE